MLLKNRFIHTKYSDVLFFVHNLLQKPIILPPGVSTLDITGALNGRHIAAKISSSTL